MTFTWKRGLVESEESPNLKRKNGTGNMNQKQWRLSASCPQVIKMAIKNQAL